MKPIQFFQKLCVAWAMVGLLVPQVGTVRGTEVRPAGMPGAASHTTKVTDVSLGDGGILQGQVVDANGLVQPHVPVTIYQGKDVLATTTTNGQGEFVVAGMRGGLYVVSTDGAAGVVRAWAPRTAPPSAVQGLLLIPADTAVRAQMGNFVNQYGLAAVVLGGLLAAVIWVAVEHNDAS